MSKESLYFSLPDMSASHDPKKIKKDLNSLPGVFSVSINTHDGKIAVDFDNTGTTREEITGKAAKMGFTPENIHEEEHRM